MGEIGFLPEYEISATESTAIFRFVDDVKVRATATPCAAALRHPRTTLAPPSHHPRTLWQIRVRAFRAGSIIDVRSRSREGSADFGVNARRIERFFAARGL